MFNSKTNNLPTKEFIETIRSAPHEHCPICGLSSENQSLMYLLNKYTTNNMKIHKRHNMVAEEVIRVLVEKHPSYTGLYENCSIPNHLVNLSQLNSSLKPDIQLWLNPKKLILIEVRVPYPGLADNYHEKVDNVFNDPIGCWKSSMNFLN